MGEWREAQLGQVCRFRTGDAFNKERQGRAVGAVPFVKVSDLNLAGNEVSISRSNNWISEEEARSYTIHPVGAVLFAKIGIALTYNRRRRIVRPTVADNNLRSATSTSVHPAWLYYLLCALDFNKISSGSALPYLTVRDLAAINIEVPPPCEQQAIAAVLSSLDDKIELNRRMNETLEASARALFRDWFVDFGPTRAKAEGCPPYFAPDLWSLFPEKMGNDGVPDGWQWAPLSDILVLQRGFDLPKGERTDGAFPVIAASGPSGIHNEMRVHGPGVCTGRSGVLGGVYYVKHDFWPLNTALWIREYPHSTPIYAFHALKEIDIGAFNAGSAVPTLNRNHIHGLPVVKPPIALIQAYDAVASELFAKREYNLLESRTLAATRDALLPKLMAGQIRVRDAEALVARGSTDRRKAQTDGEIR